MSLREINQIQHALLQNKYNSHQQAVGGSIIHNIECSLNIICISICPNGTNIHTVMPLCIKINDNCNPF